MVFSTVSIIVLDTTLLGLVTGTIGVKGPTCVTAQLQKVGASRRSGRGKEFSQDHGSVWREEAAMISIGTQGLGMRIEFYLLLACGALRPLTC